MKTKKLLRKKSALARLAAQLKSRVKTEKLTGNQIPLSPSDIKRIESEMNTLEKRVK